MKKTFLIGVLLLGTQAFGVTLAPGESIEWGRTVITCSDSSNELPLCKLERQSGWFYVSIDDKIISTGYGNDSAALEKIKQYRAAGLCR